MKTMSRKLLAVNMAVSGIQNRRNTMIHPYGVGRIATLDSLSGLFNVSKFTINNRYYSKFFLVPRLLPGNACLPGSARLRWDGPACRGIARL
jgi:hypothetical protein